jgi:L-histidine Nalpha-methyltransferase
MNTCTLLPSRDNTKASRSMASSFYKDVIRGLSHSPKFLESKYFYDSTGDRLFQEIMEAPEYYLTGCEWDILKHQAADIARTMSAHTGAFDLVELGAGDATKTRFLLRQLLADGVDFTYYPVDISAHVIESLDEYLPTELPGLRWEGLNGEYVEMLKKAGTLSSRNKIVLFMGANIGNFSPGEALQFCESLRAQLHPGDLLFIGFDLKKNPHTILSAYNDRKGITRDFNLNLLSRINREIGADFHVSDFDHYPTYDPLTGSCKSYLISTKAQRVHIADTYIDFAENEPVYMEISQKYSLREAEAMGISAGFHPVTAFVDQKGWFTDCLWRVG